MDAPKCSAKPDIKIIGEVRIANVVVIWRFPGAFTRVAGSRSSRVGVHVWVGREPRTQRQLLGQGLQGEFRSSVGRDGVAKACNRVEAIKALLELDLVEDQ